MTKRASRLKHPDVNIRAASIVQQAVDPNLAMSCDGKNPAAVALGRLGGLKGGKARAASLSKKKRSEIAKKAAMARWGKSE